VAAQQHLGAAGERPVIGIEVLDAHGRASVGGRRHRVVRQGGIEDVRTGAARHVVAAAGDPGERERREREHAEATQPKHRSEGLTPPHRGKDGMVHPAGVSGHRNLNGTGWQVLQSDLQDLQMAGFRIREQSCGVHASCR
jgi:hypothetical protein